MTKSRGNKIGGWRSNEIVRQPRVAIIGAGLSGIGIGIQLKREGLQDFTIFDKGSSLGGTWRDNHYPGLACDVPSPYYTWRFAPNPTFGGSVAKGEEILRYAERTALKEGLAPHFRFNTEVVGATWEGEGWTVTTNQSDAERFDFVVSAVGFLHHRRELSIPGLNSFQGAVLHTARWDNTVSYKGKRVGVIGNGSSGTQIMSEIAKDTSKMVAFIRSPQWVYALNEEKLFNRWWKFKHKWIPGVWQRTWQSYAHKSDVVTAILTEPGPAREAFQQGIRDYLIQAVTDPVLRAKLTPDFDPGCRRLVVSSRLYPALQLPQSVVERDPIARVVPEGIVTSSGRLHELDVIVAATGFDAQAFLTHMNIQGQDGRNIRGEWTDGLRTYFGVAIDGYPNLFMIGGPQSPLGTISFILSGELQGGYAVQWIKAWARAEFSSVVPKASAVDNFTLEFRAKAKDTVWASGCSSWYLDSTGVPSAWPFTRARFMAEMTERRLDDFVIVPVDSRGR